MRREQVPQAVTQLAFEFFFWFSRFESALKENGFLKSRTPGDRADPSWQLFVSKLEHEYTASASARRLLALAPETQVVAESGLLAWKPTAARRGTSELGLVVLMLKTIRNNLFHGAKHGAANWDDLDRTRDLLATATPVLRELAALAGFETDYERFY